MQDKIQKQILDAFFVVLRPIAKILLRYGIGYREFAEVAKSAFVDVATAEYGLRGRPTNISRVAVMTGLTRKEVRRLRDQLEGGGQLFSRKYNRLGKILHKWHSDREFLDSAGQPADIPFAGDEASFTKLVRLFGGDVPAGAMRAELKRLNAIEELSTGLLRVSRRGILPELDHDNLCLSLEHSAYALLSSIAHNTDPDRKEGPWAQLTAFTGDVRAEDILQLRRICNDRAREAIESFDDLFMGYEKPDLSEPGRGAPVAVGIFYFEEKDKKSVPMWREV